MISVTNEWSKIEQVLTHLQSDKMLSAVQIATSIRDQKIQFLALVIIKRIYSWQEKTEKASEVSVWISNDTDVSHVFDAYLRGKPSDLDIDGAFRKPLPINLFMNLEKTFLEPDMDVRNSRVWNLVKVCVLDDRLDQAEKILKLFPTFISVRLEGGMGQQFIPLIHKACLSTDADFARRVFRFVVDAIKMNQLEPLAKDDLRVLFEYFAHYLLRGTLHYNWERHKDLISLIDEKKVREYVVLEIVGTLYCSEAKDKNSGNPSQTKEYYEETRKKAAQLLSWYQENFDAFEKKNILRASQYSNFKELGADRPQ